MKKFAFVLALGFIFASAAMAATPTTFVAGTGLHHVVNTGGGRDVCNSQPQDIEQNAISSEIIADFQLETEVADDFVGTTKISGARWGGLYYNIINPCDPIIQAPGFNLHWYCDDGYCEPTTYGTWLYIDSVGGNETSTGCNSAGYPTFAYSASVDHDFCNCAIGWFGAQMQNHVFQPQWGRQATDNIYGCGEAEFYGPIFNFNVWTPLSVLVGSPLDVSQEFDCNGCGVATQPATWGSIKGLYR